MLKNYYDILGVPKTATEAEIKKAYKKQAMQYHPDRNKGDKKAESKFKEINEAYQTIGDAKKKKDYDQFGLSEENHFGWGSRGQSRQSQSAGFEDIFSQFGWGWRQAGGIEFDIGDLFGNMWANRRQEQRQSHEQEHPKDEIQSNLDVTETIEIPFLEFLYDTSVAIRTVYGKNLSLKVKAGTKPGTKYKISGKWRTIDGRTGDMYVIVDAKMPKEIPENLKPMIEAIRYQI